jgi:hypothetical protein
MASWRTYTMPAGTRSRSAVSPLHTRVSRQRPETPVIQAEPQRDLAASTDAATVGWRLRAEACRRGVTGQSDVVVIGDGAHGIGNLAAEHVPQATRMVDWYHASQDVWRAAGTIVGETSDLRIPAVAVVRPAVAVQPGVEQRPPGRSAAPATVAAAHLPPAGGGVHGGLTTHAWTPVGSASRRRRELSRRVSSRRRRELSRRVSSRRRRELSRRVSSRRRRRRYCGRRRTLGTMGINDW